MKVLKLIPALFIWSCQEHGDPPVVGKAAQPVAELSGPDRDFWTFHSRFLVDTEFQKSRYVDTVGALPDDYTRTQAAYTKFHDKSVLAGPAIDTMFAGYSLEVGGDSVIERIFDDGGTGSSKRVFKSERGRWQLVAFDRPTWTGSTYRDR